MAKTIAKGGKGRLLIAAFATAAAIVAPEIPGLDGVVATAQAAPAKCETKFDSAKKRAAVCTDATGVGSDVDSAPFQGSPGRYEHEVGSVGNPPISGMKYNSGAKKAEAGDDD